MNNFINRNIENYLIGYLNKMIINESDYCLVKKIQISSFDFQEKFISNSLEDLNKFPNLEELEVSRFILNRDNISTIEKLKNLKTVLLYKCDIKDKLNIKGKKIIISNCQKIENLILKDFDIIEIENSDLLDLNYSCNMLRYYNCKNVAKTKIKYNVLEKITYEV